MSNFSLTVLLLVVILVGLVIAFTLFMWSRLKRK